MQISTTHYAATGRALHTTPTRRSSDLSAIASFSGTTGNANLTVNGNGTARLNGNHATSGKLTLGAEEHAGALPSRLGPVYLLRRNEKANGTSNDPTSISGGDDRVISAG